MGLSLSAELAQAVPLAQSTAIEKEEEEYDDHMCLSALSAVIEHKGDLHVASVLSKMSMTGLGLHVPKLVKMVCPLLNSSRLELGIHCPSNSHVATSTLHARA